jgi:hypothetical protein
MAVRVSVSTSMNLKTAKIAYSTRYRAEMQTDATYLVRWLRVGFAKQ